MEKVLNRKEEILKVTQQLIRKDSFNKMSYSDIASEMKLSKSTIFHHFKSKDELGLQALRKYRQEIRYLTEKFEATNPDPWKKLKGYFGFFQYILKPGNEVCPAGVLSAEFNTLKPELQKELQEFFQEQRAWLSHILEDGRNMGLLKFDGSSEDKAFFIESTIQGSMLLSRMLRKPEHFKKIVKQFKNELRV